MNKYLSRTLGAAGFAAMLYLMVGDSAGEPKPAAPAPDLALAAPGKTPFISAAQRIETYYDAALSGKYKAEIISYFKKQKAIKYIGDAKLPLQEKTKSPQSIAMPVFELTGKKHWVLVTSVAAAAPKAETLSVFIIQLLRVNPLTTPKAQVDKDAVKAIILNFDGLRRGAPVESDQIPFDRQTNQEKTWGIRLTDFLSKFLPRLVKKHAAPTHVRGTGISL